MTVILNNASKTKHLSYMKGDIMTEEQEKGLSIYRQIENDLRWLENQIEKAVENRTSQHGLIASYNRKVDELGEITRLYML